MIMFAAALASRGFGNKKTDVPTKQLRVLSCLGGLDIKRACPFLRTSDVDQSKHYCGRCGCGDNKNTWLVAENTEYSKLDYPTLNCPMKMPGFSNYDPNFLPMEIKVRKEHIQKVDPEQLALIQVTIGSSEHKEDLIVKVNKLTENG